MNTKITKTASVDLSLVDGMSDAFSKMAQNVLDPQQTVHEQTDFDTGMAARQTLQDNGGVPGIAALPSAASGGSDLNSNHFEIAKQKLINSPLLQSREILQALNTKATPISNQIKLTTLDSLEFTPAEKNAIVGTLKANGYKIESPMGGFTPDLGSAMADTVGRVPVKMELGPTPAPSSPATPATPGPMPAVKMPTAAVIMENIQKIASILAEDELFDSEIVADKLLEAFVKEASDGEDDLLGTDSEYSEMTDEELFNLDGPPGLDRPEDEALVRRILREKGVSEEAIDQLFAKEEDAIL